VFDRRHRHVRLGQQLLAGRLLNRSETVPIMPRQLAQRHHPFAAFRRLNRDLFAGRLPPTVGAVPSRLAATKVTSPMTIRVPLIFKYPPCSLPDF
jgi:hypothetical protein